MYFTTSPHRTGYIPVTKKEKATVKSRENNAYSREFAPSPVFSFSNSDILTGASELIDFFQDKPEMEKYGAMTNLVIQNNSSVELKVYLNQDTNRVITLPAGVIRALEQDEIMGGVRSLIVKNNGSGTATAGLITIEAFKKGIQVDTAFQSVFKKIAKLGGY